MNPGKHGIHQQISNAIRKKWCKECTEILDGLLAGESTNEVVGTNGKDFAYPGISSVSLSRMKERIEELEDLNDRLYYYICFIVENLPELIIKTIQSDFLSHPLDFFNLPEYKNGSLALIPKESIPLPTRRERDILALLEKGYCAKEIASELSISATTVVTHKKNLKKKFNVKNTVELISKVRNMT